MSLIQLFTSQGLVGRSGKKVFNSLESGNFGEGRRASLRVIAFLTAIRQIMIYLRDRYGLDQDGCVFVVADHVGLGDPLYPQKEQARRINSTAWGRLKKCETDSLIGKVARTVKKWEIEFGSEDTILKVPEAQIRRKQSLSCKQETQTQWGFLAFIFWERSDLSFTEGSESFSYNFPQLVCGTVENQSIHFGIFFMWRCHLKQTKQWRWRRNNHECNMGVVWEGSMGPRHRVSWVPGLDIQWELSTSLVDQWKEVGLRGDWAINPFLATAPKTFHLDLDQTVNPHRVWARHTTVERTLGAGKCSRRVVKAPYAVINRQVHTLSCFIYSYHYLHK